MHCFPRGDIKHRTEQARQSSQDSPIEGWPRIADWHEVYSGTEARQLITPSKAHRAANESTGSDQFKLPTRPSENRVRRWVRRWWLCEQRENACRPEIQRQRWQRCNSCSRVKGWTYDGLPERSWEDIFSWCQTAQGVSFSWTIIVSQCCANFRSESQLASIHSSKQPIHVEYRLRC